LIPGFRERECKKTRERKKIKKGPTGYQKGKDKVLK